MALSLPPFSAAATKSKTTHISSSTRLQAQQLLPQKTQPINRRTIGLVLSSVMLSLKVVDAREASAAGRRTPPPATQSEKKDPNVSGVTAKVLASKKRKEAMKTSIAKLREQGKAVTDLPLPQ